jgi:hypothetical protein
MMKIIPKLAVCFKFDIYIFIENTTFYKTWNPQLITLWYSSLVGSSRELLLMSKNLLKLFQTDLPFLSSWIITF